MAQRLDHRRGHRHLGGRLQRLHLQEEQGETMSVDTPASTEADRGRRREQELRDKPNCHRDWVLVSRLKWWLFISVED